MNILEKIAGYEAEKKELEALIEIFNNREKYISKGASLPKGIIFYGAAGTGKTLFAQCLAEACSLNRITVNLSKCAHGDVCKMIRRAFIKGARSKTPTMIFFDELDKLLPNEDEEYYTDQSKMILTQLLTLIDGMEKVNNIVFVATCNDYGNLPASIVRPGRFDKKIGLGLPSFSSRVAILEMHIAQAVCQFGLTPESIAKLCAGFSCAAIKTLINECVLRSDENNYVSEELIRAKIVEIKNEDLPCRRPELCELADATRNIGSFIVAQTFNRGDYLLSLKDNSVCNHFFDAIISDFEYDYDDDYYDDDDDDEEEDEEETSSSPAVQSKNDLLATVTVILGGYAAEELILHKVYDNLYTRLCIIDRIMLAMSAFGMLGLHLRYTSSRNDRLAYPDQHIDDVNQAIAALTDTCYEKAKAIVSKNETLIRQLTPILLERESLEKTECDSILADLGGVQG